MPQHHKGERKYVPTRISTAVNTEAAARADGYSATGQWIADLVYAHVGRADLIVGPDIQEEELQLTA